MFTLTALLVSALAAFTTAAPVEGTTEVVGSPLDRSAQVTFYHGDTCDNRADGVNLQGSGSYRCIPIGNVRSISASGSGCTVKTWSGNNCHGNNFKVPDASCHSVLYASVSIQC